VASGGMISDVAMINASIRSLPTIRDRRGVAHQQVRRDDQRSSGCATWSPSRVIPSFPSYPRTARSPLARKNYARSHGRRLGALRAARPQLQLVSPRR
jgi:hypothetical protein